MVRTLEAGLWAFYNTDNFQDGCLKAINLGEDSDTTGAVYGQIAGAYYGETVNASDAYLLLYYNFLIYKLK